MNKKDQTIDTYNKSASSLADRFNKFGVRINDVKEGFSYISKKNPFVLEIGCANGRDAKEILKYTNNYLGIDISEELIKIAKQNISKGKFKVADVEDYIFPKNIDMIFSFASLIHSNRNNLQKILNEAHESLNVGGIFYISMKYGEYQESTKEDEFGIRTYYFYTSEDIRKIIGSSYEIIRENVYDLRGQDLISIILRKK
ncbi:MAG: class I SAM-dependent methyltransferase [Candidatus Moraniibacteriota bacterium]